MVHNTVETETQDFNPGDRLSDSLSSASSHLPSQISHIGTGFGSLASLRQELQRIRTGIEQVMSGIRDLGENSRSSQEAFGQSGILDTHIQEINGQLDALQQTRMSSPRPLPIGAIAPQNPRTNQHEAVTGSSTRPTASLALANLQSNANIMQGSEVSARTDQDGAARTLQRAENEVHAAAGSRRRLVRTYTDQEVAERVFGTREEVERQGADYESPVAGLFTRAYERYRDAEEARRNPEQDGATVRTLQRPQDARARPAGSPEAVASLNPPGSSSSFLSRRLPPNSPQSTAQARENQTRRPPSGSPSNILPGAGVTPRRPAPYSGSFQNLASQPSPQIQDYQYGQTLRQVAQLPEIPGVVPPYGQPARPMTQLPDGPGVDHPHGRPVRRPTRLPRTSEAGTAHVSPTELRNPPTYTYRPPTATPTTDFSPSSLHSYGLFIPPSDRTNLTTPAMLGSSDSSLALQRTHAVPDFSTIAPDAARMQDVSSQHQRRIIRDIRARRHELAPSTTASPDTDPFTPDVYDPNFLAAYRGSRSEDSASDSSDAALFLDRLRRRRNALGSESGGDNARLFGPPGSTEAQEAMVQRVRDRRQAGLTAAIDNLFTVEDDGIIAVDQGPRGLDRDDGRPEPKEDAEMMVNMECKICFSQLASVAVLPCGEPFKPPIVDSSLMVITGHCVMCKWCADQTIPSHKADRTRPAGVVNCPVCRKRVKQRVCLFLLPCLPNTS